MCGMGSIHACLQAGGQKYILNAFIFISISLVIFFKLSLHLGRDTLCRLNVG